jgi:TctA family transporter
MIEGIANSSMLSYFLMAWLNPYLLLLTAAGTFAGIYIGAIPGLSVTMAVSILISFTFSWDVNIDHIIGCRANAAQSNTALAPY